MREQIDAEMKKRKIDWLIISGPRHCNPNIIYFTGCAKVMHPVLVKKCGEEPLVIHDSLERGEVEKGHFKSLEQETIIPGEALDSKLSAFERGIFFYERLIAYCDIKGRVAFYGVDDVHNAFFIYQELFRRCSFIDPVEDIDENIFRASRLTKDAGELSILSDIAKRTCEVYEKLFHYLEQLRIAGKKIVDEDGNVLKLGDLRRFIYTELAKRGLSVPEIPIISTGRDAGIPHSTGDDASPIVAGRPVILDLFPQCSYSGYMTDITRTICIGRASRRVLKIYEDVRNAQSLALSEIAAGRKLSEIDGLVSEFFEKNGYPTLRQSRDTGAGYVHSLGHGVGLELHEAPRISVFNRERSPDRFLPGMVFTIEPGLYFPDEEIGIRIEDVVCLKEDGKLENLTPISKSLQIIPAGL